MIVQNIALVRQRMAEACKRVGRDPKSVRLVAVSKTFMVERIREALDSGVVDFGENYVQELRGKIEAFRDRKVRWHFIGHLQSNKVRYIVGDVHLIHTLDSLNLAAEIQKRAGQGIDALIEVHTTTETTKTGVKPGYVVDLIKEMSKFDRIRIKGLMTMGPFSDDPNDSRPSFRTLADVKRSVEAAEIEGVSMEHLSMGMTHDFEVAIEEGATLVRIGTGIFGEREKRD
ncbi:MAG: YggS family pyridoxal phosphate-dependent enzyme [Bacteroidota bacterium]